MNRAQRRQLGRKENETQYTLKHSEIKNTVDTIVKERISEIQLETVEQTMAIVCLSLNAEYGFGEKRLTTLIDRVQKQYDCLRQGYVIFSDMKKQMKEIGVQIQAY